MHVQRDTYFGDDELKMMVVRAMGHKAFGYVICSCHHFISGYIVAAIFATRMLQYCCHFDAPMLILLANL
jgi:hypothetical protein